ncbi:Rieske (2Fe-2S) protein [Rhodanobacter sp. DHG33]|uniref:Rieske (2Fe-2S) protein n=1 Tax=Rhodanobacter sp. DHG33 TaxID=2775921 RepID=UPI00177B969F|nr:Rieske (2Fe-2S) protein [Rhodanobacter sp. DHG33]MBD8897447.1 Rieske (2Fe-2S) protein [Rhodanobacter sp. DHG33]
MDTVSPPSLLCRVDEIPDGGATAIEDVAGADGESVIVARQGEEVRAWLNICPHAGRRLDYAPGMFLLKDDLLICAVHGACFNRSNGECVAGPCRGEHLRAVTVEVRDGEVWVASVV